MENTSVKVKVKGTKFGEKDRSLYTLLWEKFLLHWFSMACSMQHENTTIRINNNVGGNVIKYPALKIWMILTWNKDKTSCLRMFSPML